MENNIRARDYGISLLRLVATIFIFTCHIMQYYGSELAWWFNIGVQIFLCMSGFLYGRKGKVAPFSFYKKQLPKILLDYWIVVCTFGIIQFIFLPSEITVGRFIGSLATYDLLAGGGHLWYILYILLCYIGTPILAWIMELLFTKKREWHLVLGTLAILLAVFAVLTALNILNSAWINCYIIGFFLGFCEKNAKKSYKGASILIAIACVAMNIARIIINYILKIKFEGLALKSYDIFQNYAHVALGCAIFILVHKLFGAGLSEKLPKAIKSALNVTDRLSYDAYLVHQFFILGPMSLMALTRFATLNVTIVILLTVLSAVVAYLASSGIKRLFCLCFKRDKSKQGE